ncbi:MAG: cytochrome c biogenesis protein ResB [Elusimicrobia bacterium]|nr:cytochrome c biogenesis protein ResB [Elusimicrobiota bacterium]
MGLVTACTLAQASMGVHPAVERYIRSWFIYWRGVPVAPGGATAGLLLLANLLAAQFQRLELSWRKGGLWLVHSGLVFLFLGEFVSGAFQEESQMTLVRGRPQSYSQSPREVELALTDVTEKGRDRVYAIGEGLLRAGSLVSDARLPFQAAIKKIERRRSPGAAEGELDEVSAEVELLDQGKPIGSWRLDAHHSQTEVFSAQGRQFTLSLRPRRVYLPFTMTLEKFVHEVYPGTDIPKGFSSLVRLEDPGARESRNAVISMNNPLRRGGRSFYQASYLDDSTSILQVVSNPGRSLPYVSCVLVCAGLLLHFLRRIL